MIFEGTPVDRREEAAIEFIVDLRASLDAVRPVVMNHACLIEQIRGDAVPERPPSRGMNPMMGADCNAIRVKVCQVNPSERLQVPVVEVTVFYDRDRIEVKVDGKVLLDGKWHQEQAVIAIATRVLKTYFEKMSS